MEPDWIVSGVMSFEVQSGFCGPLPRIAAVLQCPPIHAPQACDFSLHCWDITKGKGKLFSGKQVARSGIWAGW